MTEDQQQGRQNRRRRIWFALAALVVILAVLFVPPFLSVSRYKSRITSLMAESLGRPVRLSSVSIRLLPRPGFVLNDLVVEEDAAFGDEPLLHAGSVTASIRLLSLWRGRLEISEVSVDEASLNVVRSPEGNWNLDSLLRTAATKVGTASNHETYVPPFPYIAATNSRVNFKSGVEKLPFSLVDTDLSFWQENPGLWRIRLRGQPARTDVMLDLADTGIVELTASAQRAPDLRQMPIHLDLDWRNAQLGQLTRLATGSDAGWRGDLRGEVHLDGTADSAQVKTRLRATDVHRAEFAPVAPMDFDANCGFVYHYSTRALENLVCDSPLGDGHIRLAGDLPANSGPPHFSVELDKIPVAAGLDALRTVRSDVDPGLEAAGTASGKVIYDEGLLALSAAPAHSKSKGAGPSKSNGSHSAKAGASQSALTGSFTLDGFQLSGGGLSQPIQAPKLVLAPAAAAQGHTPALTGTVAVPLGGTAPLTMNVRLGLKGYQVAMQGQVSIARGRELAHAVGISQAATFNTVAGDALAIDLNASGPWLPVQELPFSSFPLISPTLGPFAVNRVAQAKTTLDPDVIPATDTLSGTVTVHNANWKADYLANHVVISDATLHVDLVEGRGDSVWDPVNFSYGPLKGTASFSVPGNCDSPEPCPTQFQMHFDDLDAATVQTAILGAHEKSTLLSDLINRLRPSSAPAWPLLHGTVKAGSLILGPVTLKDVAAEMNFKPTGADLTSLDATLLGGKVYAAGAVAAGDKPVYTLRADFAKLDPVALGQMLGQNWRGGTFDGSGKIDLSGYTGADLSDSATGTLHFEWRQGAIAGTVPTQVARFDRWTADATIANGKIALGQNEIAQGTRKNSVDAAVPLAEPVRLSFGTQKSAQPRKAPNSLPVQ